MVPNIFTLGIAGLGPLTGKGSGILVMSIVPAAHGLLSVWRVPRLQRLKARGRILMLPAA